MKISCLSAPLPGLVPVVVPVVAVVIPDTHSIEVYTVFVILYSVFAANLFQYTSMFYYAK